MNNLALYIHWPFCRSKCPYCDFNSHVRDSVDHGAWREALLTELEWTHQHAPGKRISSIFFGGGTPSLMEPQTVQALIDRAAALWPCEEALEITLEANPTSVEAHKLRDFRSAGVNRVSMGVQSLLAADLAFLGREHSSLEALQAVEAARTLFDRYSFDLIYARPGQTPAQWEDELTRALTHAGTHLSLYQLTIEPNTAFHHAYHTARAFSLPEDNQAADLYELTQQIMESAGLPAYEISNHAAPGQECRHNLSYWLGDAYAGIGPGAHGRLEIAGEGRVATATLKSPERWLSSVQQTRRGIEIWQPLSPEERLEEKLMMQLRLREGVMYKRWAAEELEMLRAKVTNEALSRWAAHGLLEQDADGFRATSAGRLVLNRLTGELLA